jgi:hypothetical protein
VGDRGVECAPAEYDPIADEHVVRVQFARQDQLHAFPEVAERLPHRFLGVVQDDQQPVAPLALGVEPERAEHPERVLGTRLGEIPLVDHEHLAVRGAVRERRTEGKADHLLRRPLAVVARLRSVGDAAAPPLR